MSGVKLTPDQILILTFLRDSHETWMASRVSEQLCKPWPWSAPKLRRLAELGLVEYDRGSTRITLLGIEHPDLPPPEPRF